MNSSAKITSFLDKLIFVFTVIFLLTLTNSIFLNQIGYFGALLFILIRFAVTRKNPFSKTGLELPFLLFIIAEIISTAVSVNQAQAFHNLLKRFLLIPVVYTMVVAADDYKKAVLFVKIFLGAGLLTILAYIIFAYEHFIQQLYRVESKGPSPFQYVMTAGGLISIVSIYYLAFFLENKSTYKIKLIYLAGFLISLLALLASYTRAAWLGAIAGIGIMLLLKRKYLLIGISALLLLLIVLLIPNESKVLFYKDEPNKPVLEKVMDTPGRAYGVKIKNGKTFVADYENGILIIDSAYSTHTIRAPFPVTEISFWDGNLFAKLVDGRFVLWEKKGENRYEQKTEFVSPGDTRSFALVNDNLYVNDLDSGVTVYTNSNDIKAYKRFPEINGARIITVNEKFLAIYNLKNKLIKIYKLDSLFLPAGIPQTVKLEKNFVNLFLWKNYLFADNEDGLYAFDLKEKNKKHKTVEGIGGVITLLKLNGTAAILTADGKINFIKPGTDRISVYKTYPLEIKPASFDIEGKRIAVTSYKRNRFLSVIDMYHTTNIQRLIQWETGMKILRDHPLFGVGDIDLQKIFSEYKPYYLKKNFGHLHNNYVHILVILGVFGFVVFVILLAKIFGKDFGVYRAVQKGTIESAFALGTIGAFTAFLVSGLAEWNFGDHEIITMIWFTLGLNIALYKTSVKIGKHD